MEKQDLRDLFDFTNAAGCADAIQAVINSNSALLSALVHANGGDYRLNIEELPSPDQLSTLFHIKEFFQSHTVQAEGGL